MWWEREREIEANEAKQQTEKAKTHKQHKYSPHFLQFVAHFPFGTHTEKGKGHPKRVVGVVEWVVKGGKSTSSKKWSNVVESLF